MKAPKKEKHFINKPSYPGGPKALWTFIRQNLKYPKEALENKIAGVVRLKYTIGGNGKITSTQIIHSLGYGCDEEAIRVIGMLIYHIPKHRKLKVKFHKTINVRFNLPKKASIKVNLTKKKAEAKEETKEEKKPSYGYTITIK